MNQLNLDSYNQLCKDSFNARALDNWYSFSYNSFINSPLNTLEDFWRIVAYAYSWMPTIPTVRPSEIKEPQLLLIHIQTLKNGNATQLPTLLQELIPVINNSLTGVSKVLHFIAPTLVPIIDRNVLYGWNEFFFKRHSQYQVPKLPSNNVQLSTKHIPKYLQYRDTLLQWQENCNGEVTLRELEEGFFELGKYCRDSQTALPSDIVF